MATRYESRPVKFHRSRQETAHHRALWDEWGHGEISPRSLDVIVEESDTFTGLYDAEGRELLRVKPAIGFRL